MAGQVARDLYGSMRALIVDGTYGGGHRLVEADIAATLGVSRGYVREVLARLEFEGLVEKETGRSATVRRVSKSEALEILQARIALEGIVARSAATRRTDAQAKDLVAAMQSLEARAEASDVAGVLTTQATFHHAVLAAGRQPVIQRLVLTLSALTAQTRRRSMLLPGRIPASIREHRAICSAVAAREPEAAEKAMAAHLHAVARAITALPDSAQRNTDSHSSSNQEVSRHNYV
jgi:DNA-binding GntR family transcriptional regulator